MKKARNVYILAFLFTFPCCNAQHKASTERAFGLNGEVSDSVVAWTLHEERRTADNFNLALNKIDEAIALVNDNTLFYGCKISLLELFKKENDVIDVLNKELTFLPNFAEGFFAKGFYYEKDNQLDSAIIAYSNARAIFEKRKSDTSDYKKLTVIQLSYLISRDKNSLNKQLSIVHFNNPGIVNLRDMMITTMIRNPDSVGYKFIFGKPQSTIMP